MYTNYFSLIINKKKMSAEGSPGSIDTSAIEMFAGALTHLWSSTS